MPLRAGRPKNEYLASERRLRIAFLSPALIIIAAVLFVPLAYAVRNSFYRINLARSYQGEQFIGLRNYIQAFSDPYFINSLLVSLVITIAVVSLELVIGLFLALLLNKPLERRMVSGKRLFRTLAILPVVLPPVVVGLMWRFMFQYTGIINYLLTVAGLSPVAWTNPFTGIVTIIATIVWQNVPFSFLLILAGLQSVPPDLIDSAMVDGASGAQRLTRLYLPLIRPIIFLILTIRTMDALRTFDEAFILTGGGPGRSTETISLFIYTNSFSFFNIGYGSALSMILMLMLMFITVFYMRLIYGREQL
jgi:multiple sugar transport system permease protein